MPTERRPSGHGLDDEAVTEGHDFMHKVEQEQHQRDADMKRGLPDSAIEAEHEFEDMVEGSGHRQASTHTSKPLGSKVKETLEKLVPGNGK